MPVILPFTLVIALFFCHWKAIKITCLPHLLPFIALRTKQNILNQVKEEENTKKYLNVGPEDQHSKDKNDELTSDIHVAALKLGDVSSINLLRM